MLTINLFFFKYGYTYTSGYNYTTTVRVKNNLTALCYGCTFRRDPRCAKVPFAVTPDRRRIVSLELLDLTYDQTRR